MPTSCDIYDDLPPCPRGLSLNFVYDYNMEYADAFSKQVDCLTVYVYDEQGNLVSSFTEVGDKLKDKDYRLNVDLKHGKYHVVAYGGMACADCSFEPVAEPAVGSKLADLKVKLNHQDATSNVALHNFYHGAADFTVEGEMYKEATVSLVKNTNNFRIMLQHVNGTVVPVKDFEFSIVDDNALFDHDNNLIANGGITYLPWVKGEVSSKANGEEIDEMNAAYAEFSTSRLVTSSKNRLIINRVKDGKTILNLSLNDVLLLLKSQQFDKMGAQEFLDRESNWTLVFFLVNGENGHDIWYNIKIIVNGWTVRLNDVEL